MATETEISLLITARDAAANAVKALGDRMRGAKQETAEAQKAAKSFDDTLKGIINTIKGVVVALGLLKGAQAVLHFLADTLRLAGEDEASVLRLSAAVKASGGNWQTAAGQIETYLRAERDRVALDDGEGRESLIQLITLTGDYTSAMKLLPIAIDVARAKGMDLVSASELIGRVSQGNTAMLTRYGIVLREGASATEALAEIQRRFAGQGEAWAQSYQGQLRMLQITWQEIKEGIGAGLLPLATRTLGWIKANLLQPVEAAIKALGPLISDELLGIVRDVFPHGANISQSIARGIQAGAVYILAALKTIRGIIAYMLKPGSPPRLLPELGDWGKAAAEEWFRGWGEAEFTGLKEMSDVIGAALRAAVGRGLLAEDALGPALREARAQIAAALDELRRTGAVSPATLAGFGGPTGAYAQAYLRRRQAESRIEQIQAQLRQARTVQEVQALAKQLDLARDQAEEAQTQEEIERERLEALTDETEILAQQLDVLKETKRATKELADDFRQAFDPALIETFADRFVSETDTMAGEWDALFDPQAMASKAQAMSDGWLRGLQPMLDSLKNLIYGEMGLYQWEHGWRYERRGGLFAKLRESIDAAIEAVGNLKRALELFIAGDWQAALKALGFTPEQIKSVETMTTDLGTLAGAVRGLAGAIRSIQQAWADAKAAGVDYSDWYARAHGAGPAPRGEGGGGAGGALGNVQGTAGRGEGTVTTPTTTTRRAPTGQPPYPGARWDPVRAVWYQGGLLETLFRQPTLIGVGDFPAGEYVTVRRRGEPERRGGGVVQQINNFYVTGETEQIIAQAQRDAYLQRIAARIF